MYVKLEKSSHTHVNNMLFCVKWLQQQNNFFLFYTKNPLHGCYVKICRREEICQMNTQWVTTFNNSLFCCTIEIRLYLLKSLTSSIQSWTYCLIYMPRRNYFSILTSININIKVNAVHASVPKLNIKIFIPRAIFMIKAKWIHTLFSTSLSHIV